VAITDDNKVVLTEQWRQPVHANVIDLPAGLIEPGEIWKQAAARELLEETGYDGHPFSAVGEFPTSPGLTNELYTLVQAGHMHKVEEPKGDGTERITVHEIELAKLADWMHGQFDAGKLIDPKVFVMLTYALSLHIEKLNKKA
jgi:ADP-ribose pyrophosphatase